MDTPPFLCDNERGIMRKERNMAKVVAKLAETAVCIVLPDNH